MALMLRRRRQHLRDGQRGAARHGELCVAAMAGDATAIAINNKVFPLHQKLFIEPNPVPVKWALAEMGKMPAGIRLPLVPLAEIATPPCARLREAASCPGL
jgi:dihydrodipicolinate synthase/N-acetylneuraminate lyase